MFSQIFCESIGISLFVRSDTYKCEIAYIWIFPVAEAEPTLAVVVVVVVLVLGC